MKTMKIIDLLNIKSKNEIIPKLIKIMWLDYEVKYYLDEEFWYRDIRDSEPLKIKPSQLNIEVEVIEEIENPKKIEYIKKNQNRNDKINEIIDSVNYLLEKSDKDE